MIDLTKEQMREKFRHDTIVYWVLVLALHGMMLLAIRPHVVNGMLAFIFIVLAVSDAVIYVICIMLFWMPESYYSGLVVCTVCGETAVKQVNKAKCLECGDEQDYD